MALANENYLKTPEVYCFDDLEKIINAYKILNPHKKIIRLDIGSAARPLPSEAVSAMQGALAEMGHAAACQEYGPLQGYDFLIEKILKDYRTLGVSLDKGSIFINSGAKSALGNIGHILGRDNIIAVAGLVYPVYENTVIMSGRSGVFNKEDGRWSNIVYLHSSEENGFIPEIPQEHVDIIYLCSPGSPAGTAMNRTALKKWVDYARENKSIIIYDGTYSAYISEPDIPRSIYEIKGAKRVAVEVRSCSKSAESTGLRCGYSVFPKELAVYTQLGEKVSLMKLWSLRNANYSNGVPYIIQRGAEALYSRKGKKQVKELADYYLKNALMLREGLAASGCKVFGGINSPYVWFKVPGTQTSMEYHRQLLYTQAVAGMPGILFGKPGERYMRFTGFCSREDAVEALERLKPPPGSR